MLRIEPRDPMLFTLRLVQSRAGERCEEDVVLELMFSAYLVKDGGILKNIPYPNRSSTDNDETHPTQTLCKIY